MENGRDKQPARESLLMQSLAKVHEANQLMIMAYSLQAQEIGELHARNQSMAQDVVAKSMGDKVTDIAKKFAPKKEAAEEGGQDSGA